MAKGSKRATGKAKRSTLARTVPGWLRAEWEKAIEPVLEAASSNPGGTTSPQDRRQSRIKIAVYRMVLQLRASNRLKLILDVVGYMDWEPKKQFLDNPFHWAFYAIDREGELYRVGKKKKRSALNIGEEPLNAFAWQLLYAEKHQIPPELLIGFIYQTAGSKRAKKNVKANHMEPWFPDYIASKNRSV